MFVWRLVKSLISNIVCGVVDCLPMHGVILSASSAHSPLHSTSYYGVELHLDVVTHVTGIALETFLVDISITFRNI